MTPPPPLSVAAILRDHADEYRSTHCLTPEQSRLLARVERCRTAALGGHLYVCPECGFEQPHYNGCRHRGCPNCQALAQARWIQERERRLLPVGHHHVVFTLPGQLRPLARTHARAVFDAFFWAIRDTFTTLAADVFDGRIGVTAVLHTWTRKLLYHPHVHCIVTAGALTLDDTRWVDRTRYLFPVARMKALFRARLLHHLSKQRREGALPLREDATGDGEKAWSKLLRSLPVKRRWVVFIERPLGRSTHVIRYLGRYTHRIGISDQRLISHNRHGVRFRTRDGQSTTIPAMEFVRRFLLHTLPRGFKKIRHYGLYAPTNVNTRLQVAHDLLGNGDANDLDEFDADASEETWSELLARLIDADPLRCPRCKVGRLVLVRVLPPQQKPLPALPLPQSRGPP